MLINWLSFHLVDAIYALPSTNDEEAPEQYFPKCQSSSQINGNSIPIYELKPLFPTLNRHGNLKANIE